MVCATGPFFLESTILVRFIWWRLRNRRRTLAMLSCLFSPDLYGSILLHPLPFLPDCLGLDKRAAHLFERRQQYLLLFFGGG